MYSSIDHTNNKESLKENADSSETCKSSSLNAYGKPTCLAEAETKAPEETHSLLKEPQVTLVEAGIHSDETMITEPQTSVHNEKHACSFLPFDNSKYSQVHELKDEETFEESANSSKVLESTSGGETKFAQKTNLFLGELRVVLIDIRTKDKVVSEDSHRPGKNSYEKISNHIKKETLVRNSHQSRRRVHNKTRSSQPSRDKHTQVLAQKEEMDRPCDVNSEAGQSSISKESEKGVQVDMSDMKQESDMEGDNDELDMEGENDDMEGGNDELDMDVDNTKRDITDEAPSIEIQTGSLQGTISL